MATKTPREAFEEYMQMQKARQKATEQHAVSTGGVQEDTGIAWGQALGGVTEFVVGNTLWRLGKFPANDKDVRKYQRDVDAKHRAVRDAEKALDDVKMKTGHDAKVAAIETRVSDIDTRLAEIDADLKAGSTAGGTELDIQRAQAEVNRYAAFKGNKNIKKVSRVVKLGLGWPDDQLNRLYKEFGFDPSTGLFSDAAGQTPRAIEWGVEVVKDTNGKYYFKFPETGTVRDFVGQNVRENADGLIAKPRAASKSLKEYSSLVEPHGMTAKEITAAQQAADEALKKANGGKTIDVNALEAEKRTLMAEKARAQADLDYLKKNPDPKVVDAESKLAKAKSQLETTVKKAPKGVKVDTSIAPPKAAKVPQPTGFTKYFKGAGLWGLKGLGAAGMTWGVLEVIDSWNAKDLEQGSGTRNATDVQGDQGAQNSGTVSQEDEKYFKDKELNKKFVKVMMHYSMYPMNDEKGPAEYLPALVYEQLVKMNARAQTEPGYVDASELELRKALVAAYDENPALFEETSRKLDNMKPALEVLAYYCKHGGKDASGEFQTAEYWIARAQDLEAKHYTGPAVLSLIDELEPHYAEVVEAVKREDAAETVEPQKTVLRPETNTKPTVSVPAKPERKKRVEASRIPGEPESQPAPQMPQNKEAASKQSNATNTLRGAGYDISSQTTEMDQTRTSGGRGGMA